ncbi:predicted nucleotidyltransferase [Candidatus Vecturithrix granuli]|uniref:Predicted nucleotidyltransferase n=1 Tax=Vecturithrix granuli TaxID=1499967 RepID=A0A081C966_VECG1|nr:predicted nucleotidyltransferase [Candidatus Vecturithrix granuli]
MNDIPQKCRETLAEYYGERLQGVILYGSTARKEATAASDLDLLVLLRPPFDFFQELWQITDLLCYTLCNLNLSSL